MDSALQQPLARRLAACHLKLPELQTTLNVQRIYQLFDLGVAPSYRNALVRLAPAIPALQRLAAIRPLFYMPALTGIAQQQQLQQQWQHHHQQQQQQLQLSLQTAAAPPNSQARLDKF